MKCPSLIVLLALLPLLAGCGQRGASDTIKIGSAGVRTGPDGQIGSTMFHGTSLAVQEWNDRGGVLGKKIELIERDDEGKPQQAVAVAHELTDSNVVAVIGHFNSGCTSPASAIYQSKNILEITPASTNPQITEQGISTLFRLCGRDDQQGSVSAEYAWERLGVKKVAVLHNKTAYGQGLAEEFQKRFTSLGGTITSFTGVSADELDFRANLSVLKSQAPEAVFWGGMYAQGGPLYNQMRQAGMEIPFLGGEGCWEQEFVNTIGGDAKGVFITFGPDYKTKPASQPFLEKYRKQFGEEGPYTIYGYEAANILLGAIQEAGTTESKKVAEVIRSHAWETSMGTIQFNEKGDLAKANFIIWTVRAGKLVPVE